MQQRVKEYILLYKLIREDPSEEVIFEQIPERYAGITHTVIWGGALYRQNSTCKGPEVGLCLECLRDRETKI